MTHGGMASKTNFVAPEQKSLHENRRTCINKNAEVADDCVKEKATHHSLFILVGGRISQLDTWTEGVSSRPLVTLATL